MRHAEEVTTVRLGNKVMKFMFRKTLSLMLAGSLICALLCVPSVCAKSKVENEAQQAEKVKACIAQLGVGKDARVRVRLWGGETLAGYVKQAREDFFIIQDLKSGTATVVPYPDVTQVKVHHLNKRREDCHRPTEYYGRGTGLFPMAGNAE